MQLRWGRSIFSHFQYEAWQWIPEVNVTTFCNRSAEWARQIREKYGIECHYADYREMPEKEKPRFFNELFIWMFNYGYSK